MALFGNAATRLNPNKPGSMANSYSTGNRIYGGFSPSPHAGAGSVNPAGYMDRDRQAQVKRNLLLQQTQPQGRL
jgi:hypothetical protein